MFTLVVLSLLGLLFVVSAIMIPVAIVQANKIRTAAVAAGTTPVIPGYFNWVVWLIVFCLTLFIICILLFGAIFFAAIPTSPVVDKPIVVERQTLPSAQFGLFVVSNGYGINGVYGGPAPESVAFYADGMQVFPIKTDCRPFENPPFYGYEVATRCDYIFTGNPSTVEVVPPQGYKLVQRGITLYEGASALSNSSWVLP